jgi:hypothetical protein
MPARRSALSGALDRVVGLGLLEQLKDLALVTAGGLGQRAGRLPVAIGQQLQKLPERDDLGSRRRDRGSHTATRSPPPLRLGIGAGRVAVIQRGERAGQRLTLSIELGDQVADMGCDVGIDHAVVLSRSVGEGTDEASDDPKARRFTSRARARTRPKRTAAACEHACRRRVTTVAAGAAQRPLASGYPPPRLLRSRHTKRRALTLAATSAGLLVVNPETEVRDLRAVVNDLRRVAEYWTQRRQAASGPEKLPSPWVVIRARV